MSASAPAFISQPHIASHLVPTTARPLPGSENLWPVKNGGESSAWLSLRDALRYSGMMFLQSSLPQNPQLNCGCHLRIIRSPIRFLPEYGRENKLYISRETPSDEPLKGCLSFPTRPNPSSAAPTPKIHQRPVKVSPQAGDHVAAPSPLLPGLRLRQRPRGETVSWL